MFVVKVLEHEGLHIIVGFVPLIIRSIDFSKIYHIRRTIRVTFIQPSQQRDESVKNQQALRYLSPLLRKACPANG